MTNDHASPREDNAVGTIYNTRTISHDPLLLPFLALSVQVVNSYVSYRPRPSSVSVVKAAFPGGREGGRSRTIDKRQNYYLNMRRGVDVVVSVERAANLSVACVCLFHFVSSFWFGLLLFDSSSSDVATLASFCPLFFIGAYFYSLTCIPMDLLLCFIMSLCDD